MSVIKWRIGLLMAFPCIIISGTALQGQRYLSDCACWKYEGFEVPKYFAVVSFFDLVNDTRGIGEEALNLNVFQPLGIDPASPAATALKSAAEAAASAGGNPPDLELYKNDPIGFEKVQVDYVRRGVQNVGRIYTNLLTVVGGELAEKVERFIADEIWSLHTISVSPAPGVIMAVIESEFEQVARPGETSPQGKR